MAFITFSMILSISIFSSISIIFLELFLFMAERVGFEPTRAVRPLAVFRTAPFNLLGTAPYISNGNRRSYIVAFCNTLEAPDPILLLLNHYINHVIRLRSQALVRSLMNCSILTVSRYYLPSLVAYD